MLSSDDPLLRIADLFDHLDARRHGRVIASRCEVRLDFLVALAASHEAHEWRIAAFRRIADDGDVLTTELAAHAELNKAVQLGEVEHELVVDGDLAQPCLLNFIGCNASRAEHFRDPCDDLVAVVGGIGQRCRDRSRGCEAEGQGNGAQSAHGMGRHERGLASMS